MNEWDTPEEFTNVVAKSSVKLKKTTRGVTWDIKVVQGDTEEQLNELRKSAIVQHEVLSDMFLEADE